MQFAQGVGMLDGYFGRELAAAFASPNFLAAGAAIDVAAAFEFDQIAAVAEDDPFFQERGDGAHASSIVINGCSVAGRRCLVRQGDDGDQGHNNSRDLTRADCFSEEQDGEGHAHHRIKPGERRDD